MSTVRDIVAAWLAAERFDGLYRDGCDCRGPALMRCSHPDVANCQPGWLHEGHIVGRRPELCVHGGEDPAFGWVCRRGLPACVGCEHWQLVGWL